MSDPYKVAVSEAYKRQFGKLKTEILKEEARKCRRDIYEMLTLQQEQGNTDRVREIVVKRRLKPIQRFKNEKPSRWEATFAPDGRIVFAVDRSAVTLYFIYIGNHSVLDKE